MTVMDPRRIVRAGAIVVLTGLAATTTGGTAYAYWSATGAGTGGAQAGSASPVTAAAVTPSANLLYPGGTGDLKLTISNSNPFPVTVTAITAGAGSVTGTGGTGSCTVTGVSLAPQIGLSIAVAAGGSTPVTLTGAVSMSNASDTGCQNAVFTVPVSITAASG